VSFAFPVNGRCIDWVPPYTFRMLILFLDPCIVLRSRTKRLDNHRGSPKAVMVGISHGSDLGYNIPTQRITTISGGHVGTRYDDFEFSHTTRDQQIRELYYLDSINLVCRSKQLSVIDTSDMPEEYPLTHISLQKASVCL
jgi:hypothetical protein